MHVDLSLMTLAACALAGVVPWSPDEDDDAVAQGEEAAPLPADASRDSRS